MLRRKRATTKLEGPSFRKLRGNSGLSRNHFAKIPRKVGLSMSHFVPNSLLIFYIAPCELRSGSETSGGSHFESVNDFDHFCIERPPWAVMTQSKISPDVCEENFLPINKAYMFSDMHTENIMASVILPHHKQVGIRQFLPNGFIPKVLDYQFMPMGFGIWCEGRN